MRVVQGEGLGPTEDGRPEDFALATAVSRIVVPALSVRRNALSLRVGDHADRRAVSSSR